MRWTSILAIFVLFWTMSLFLVLPWGVRVPDNPEPGHASSAPANPRLWRKALITVSDNWAPVTPCFAGKRISAVCELPKLCTVASPRFTRFSVSRILSTSTACP